MTATPGTHATPAEREALAAGVCNVCGRSDDNLSTLARCWDCIRAASGAWEAKIAAAAQVAQPRPTSRCRICAGMEDVPQLDRPRHNSEACTLPRYLRYNHPCAPESGTTTTPQRGDPVGRLRGLLRKLNAATEPGRNETLHWVACRVGEMLAAGELSDVHLAADTLAQVALGIGLDPREIRGTIRSGFAKSGVYL